MAPRKRGTNDIEILIAEDSLTQRERLKHLLEEQNFKVTAATNGKEALLALRKRKPSLVVSDIIMPEMDGYTLCKEIKSNKRLREIPVVLLTALSNPEDIIMGLKSGADNFIRKPYDEKYLLSRVDYILTNRDLRRSEKLQMGLEIYLGGQRHFITSERQQILDLLISTYEEAVRLNKELDAANKELDAFSYSVSHDLRAPLRAIDGFSRILIETHAGDLPSEAQRYLGLVRQNVLKMGHLIDDLLTFSRLSRQPLSKLRVHPAEIARQALQDLRQQQDNRRVEISIDNLPPCEADPSLLRQVFANLLSNAFKYTRQQEVARIEVGCQRKDDKTIYFVRDNGIGFDMRYADKLFGVFQRLHREEDFEGTGVGLAIVNRIVHRHGGQVWGEGAVGKGASFYFTL